MPIYEYECAKCGEFEVTQRITDAPLKKCPKCRSKVTKLISNTSFQLKGTGWYVTDYARGGAAGKGGSDAAKDAGSTSKTESKTDSKSDTKSDSKADSGGGKSEAKPEKTTGKGKAAA